jgi:SPX domain protein involved in polyphosphate accumulation
MAEDRMQLQRFELKYRIKHEATALAVRDFVSMYLEVDEYGATLPQYSYPVHSLYLDSPGLKLYWDTINGSKNRYKLRLRFYENRQDAPVYFEIKRRMNNIIAKQRGGVKREAVDILLAGHLPEPGHLVSRDPKHLVALQNFCHLAGTIHARPRTHIAYRREAWLSSRDNSVRVTLDREVRTESEPTAWLSTDMRHPRYVFGTDIILELKFTNRFPNWFGDLVRHFGLQQSGAAKYVEGVTKLGESRVSRGFAVERRETGRKG